VRFRAGGEGAGPRPGQAGWVVLTARQHRSLVVPDGAVIQSAAGPYVLVASPDNRTFSKQPVEIGKDFNGLGAVISGLGGGERMAVESAFFLDAERRLGVEHAPQ
jgi:cobalt-zinc-cadmium efflux system membrane fusion protein